MATSQPTTETTAAATASEETTTATTVAATDAAAGKKPKAPAKPRPRRAAATKPAATATGAGVPLELALEANDTPAGPPAAKAPARPRRQARHEGQPIDAAAQPTETQAGPVMEAAPAIVAMPEGYRPSPAMLGALGLGPVAYSYDPANYPADHLNYLQMLSEKFQPENRVLDFENPADMRQLVAETKTFIEAHGLYITFERDNKFVNVEGWAFAASRLGWMAQVVKIKTSGPGCWVKVQVVRLSTGLKIGKGWGYCDDHEKGKEEYSAFALCSMAQTRAIGKAYRNLLGWVIRAAGFASTPAEEMDFKGPGNQARPQVLPESQQQAPSPHRPALAAATATVAAAVAAVRGDGEAGPYAPVVQPVVERKAAAKKAAAAQTQAGPVMDTHPALAAEAEAQPTGPRVVPTTEPGYGDGPALDIHQDRLEPSEDAGDYVTGEEGKPINKTGPLTVPANIYATGKQKERIITLLRHPTITIEEKTKMLVGLNKLSGERAAGAIRNLEKEIDDRGGIVPAE